MKNISNIMIMLLLTILVAGCNKKQITTLEFIQKAEGVTFKQVSGDTMFNAVYMLRFKQPVDHTDPSKGYFEQKVHWSHINFDRPVVMVTEGYSMWGTHPWELTQMLNTNQIIVEHRYFGESVPDSLDYKYLTIQQAAADHHRIIEFFKQIYKGSWLTTGISKGGQTTLYHRRQYPDDVDVSVPYVAPIIFEQEDPRIYTFLDTVGTEECRKKIEYFQEETFKRRDEIVPLLNKFAKDKGISFSLGTDVIFEYVTLEYSFAFWQWGRGNCEDIPDTSSISAEDMLKHLLNIVPISSYTDKGIESSKSFYYQAYTQLGYYGYKLDKFGKYLKAVDYPTNSIFGPDVDMTFDPTQMRDINNWLQTEAKNIIYIYGAADTWSACAPDVSMNKNCLFMMLKDGSHGTRIRNFSDNDKKLITEKLKRWGM
jgi:hypothetical protein